MFGIYRQFSDFDTIQDSLEETAEKLEQNILTLKIYKIVICLNRSGDGRTDQTKFSEMENTEENIRKWKNK